MITFVCESNVCKVNECRANISTWYYYLPHENPHLTTKGLEKSKKISKVLKKPRIVLSLEKLSTMETAYQAFPNSKIHVLATENKQRDDSMKRLDLLKYDISHFSYDLYESPITEIFKLKNAIVFVTREWMTKHLKYFRKTKITYFANLEMTVYYSKV